MKTMLLISAGILLFALLAYYAFNAFISAPLYRPGDLTTKAEYQHLLQTVTAKDRPNYFDLNDSIALHYFTQGKGKPVLIVHGGPGIPNAEAWSGLDSLSNDYQFYYYDQRGCGQSTRPFDRFTSKNVYENLKDLNANLGLPAQVADIEQIRRKLGVEKLSIIGHSFGGFLATLYAIEFPDQVESLLLITPAEVLKIPSESGGLYTMIEEKLPTDEVPAFQAYLKEVMDFKNVFTKSEAELVALNKRFIPFYYSAIGRPNPYPDDDLGIGGWLQNAVFVSMGRKHDFSKQLEKIKAPTLIIHGEEDMVPLASVQLYLDHIPNSRLQTIPQAEHRPFEEQAERFGEIVKAELAKY